MIRSNDVAPVPRINAKIARRHDVLLTLGRGDVFIHRVGHALDPFVQRYPTRNAVLDYAINYSHNVHMENATIAQLRNRLSAYLRDVERGERVLIRRRDRVIAELRPSTNAALVNSPAQALEEKLAGLERDGFLRQATKPLPPWCLLPIPGPSAPVLETLLAEREDGR